MNTEPKRYGMYSQQQAAEFGTFFYIKDEVSIEVSATGTDPEFKDSNWPDKVLLGEVGSFHKLGRLGTYQIMLNSIFL